MKSIRIILLLALVMTGVATMSAQQTDEQALKQELVDLSQKKWDWMASKNVDSLRVLFHDESMFVHMGGSWGKQAELRTIKEGFIWYKHAEVHSREVKLAGNTAVVYSNIQLTSEVGGHEVSFPFTASEVYVKNADSWQLLSLIFSRLAEKGK